MNPNLDRIITLCRMSLGLVWIYQGIVPKMLLPLEFELDIIQRSRMYIHTPEVMIFLVGIAEAGIGVWLLCGYRERFACLTATVFMLLLQTIVIFIEPSLLVGPFGGLTKNIGLIALAWIVWRYGSEHATALNRFYGGWVESVWHAIRNRKCALRASWCYLTENKL